MRLVRGLAAGCSSRHHTVEAFTPREGEACQSDTYTLGIEGRVNACISGCSVDSSPDEPSREPTHLPIWETDGFSSVPHFERTRKGGVIIPL